MATAYATAQDVAARWRPLTPDELTLAGTLAGDASVLIRQRFPGIDAQVASGGVDAEILKIVVSNMVKRALIAPEDGLSQHSESAGPFSEAKTYANPMRNVFLTTADLTLILGYQPTGQSHAFANDTTKTSGEWYSRVYGW